jgi:chemotaxis protein methyltransferase CheR
MRGGHGIGNREVAQHNTMSTQQVLTPLAPMGAVDQVNDAQLSRYAELIYARTGVRISPQKKLLLSNRLRRRLRSTGIETFEAYYEHLKKLPPRAAEWDAFVQEITTHETYLFRDAAHWEWFRNEYLPELAASNAKSGHGSLRIWSAACSTGDEAYTAACCVAARLDPSRWQVRILGTDIGLGALEQAKTGVFGERAMRLAPAEYRCRFFTKAGDVDAWTALPVLTDMLTFRQHNLMEPLHERLFDLVLLKNVLIYFSQQSKATVLHNVRGAMRPGGLIVTGMAEGVADLLRDFERLKPWLFRKPDLLGAQR